MVIIHWKKLYYIFFKVSGHKNIILATFNNFIFLKCVNLSCLFKCSLNKLIATTVIDVIELFGFSCIFWCYKHLISS